MPPAGPRKGTAASKNGSGSALNLNEKQVRSVRQKPGICRRTKWEKPVLTLKCGSGGFRPGCDLSLLLRQIVTGCRQPDKPQHHRHILFRNNASFHVSSRNRREGRQRQSSNKRRVKRLSSAASPLARSMTTEIFIFARRNHADVHACPAPAFQTVFRPRPCGSSCRRDDGQLADFLGGNHVAQAEFLFQAVNDLLRLEQIRLVAVKEMSVVPTLSGVPWLMFCTIMSTLTVASPSALKMRAPRRVCRARPRA